MCLTDALILAKLKTGHMEHFVSTGITLLVQLVSQEVIGLVHLTQIGISPQPAIIIDRQIHGLLIQPPE